MIYLSQVVLDPRSRATGRALADLYALHKLVYSAFPDREDGGAGRVLFRIEAAGKGRDERPRLLVQSEREPDWDRLAGQIVCAHGPKTWQPQFQQDQTLRFRLRASPTKRKPFPRGDPRAGRQRVGLLTRAEQAAWLARQGERCGFTLRNTPSGWFDAFDEEEPRVAVEIVSLHHLKGRKVDAETGQVRILTHLAVDFDGLLCVTDPAALAQAAAEGLGPGKAFGFGLLSLARYA